MWDYRTDDCSPCYFAAKLRKHDREGTTLITEDRDRWHIFQFGFVTSNVWIQAMESAGIVRIPAQTLGPLNALRLRQDVYGRWERDHTITLYLVPDRVLVDWHTALRNDQIRDLAVVDAPARLNVLDRDLLRITYTTDDDARNIIGFVMDDGEAKRWAQVLHTHSGAPLEIITGRKKKQV